MSSSTRVLLIVLGVTLVASRGARAFEDPTGGRPFFAWVWADQVVPTLRAASETGSLAVLGAGASATGLSFRYDQDVQRETRDFRKLSRDAAAVGSCFGSGLPGVAIAAGQLFFDQHNGLAHARALALTSLSHASLAFTLRRERPNKKARVAFPSGHASSAFASATSLAYSYGWAAGAPAFAAAGLVASAKLADNQHWFTDVLFGATLGLFWGRASAISGKHRDRAGSGAGAARFEWAPVPIGDGLGVGFAADF